MSDHTNLPRSDWLELALMSRDDEEYTDEWGTILDEQNFERLDREVILSGPYEERPEEAPHDGAKYHATDLNAVFAWDAVAAEWTVLNTGTADDPLPGTAHLESVRTNELGLADAGDEARIGFDAERNRLFVEKEV